MEKSGVCTERLLDVIHLNRGLTRRISKLSFSDTIFPAVTSKHQLYYLRDHLCDDIVYRIRAESKAAQYKYRDDVQSISKHVI